MRRIQFSKEKISVDKIGHQRFWIGIVAGVVSAISISLAFNYTREVFRFLTSMSADMLILEDNELQFFNFFFSTLATVLGFSISIWIWMGNNDHIRNKDRIYKRLSKTNILLTFWVILMLIARFGSILPIILYGRPGYDNHLNLFEEYWALFVLIPVVVFAQNWVSVRQVYHSGKWMFFGFLFCILTAFILQLTTTVDQEKLNHSYFLKFQKDYQYIDDEIKNAQTEYGIEFDSITIDVLKKWHSETSVEQLMSLKRAFSGSKPVSLDTIILQKIVIRNFKQTNWYYHPMNSIKNWQYALPIDIMKQLEFFDVNSNQTKELFGILKEQIVLLNSPKIDWEEYENYTKTERRRSLGVKYNVSEPLRIQLKEVLENLMISEKYYGLAQKLPKLNM